jgi:hypothetical protein
MGGGIDFVDHDCMGVVGVLGIKKLPLREAAKEKICCANYSAERGESKMSTMSANCHLEPDEEIKLILYADTNGDGERYFVFDINGMGLFMSPEQMEKAVDKINKRYAEAADNG